MILDYEENLIMDDVLILGEVSVSEWKTLYQIILSFGEAYDIYIYMSNVESIPITTK